MQTQLLRRNDEQCCSGYGYVSLTNLDEHGKLSYDMRVNSLLEKNRGDLLRIGEFAKLVGCSVVSLRYYEEIGALVPAFVDEQTGYRYYTVQQTYQARLVRICIDVGISPKGLKAYFEGADVLEMYNLFDSFSEAVEERLREAREKQTLIHEMEIEYRRQLAVEPLRARWIYARPAMQLQMATSVSASKRIDVKTYLRSMNELMEKAHKLGITPLAQQGFHRVPNSVWYAYLAVMDNNDLRAKVEDDPALRLARTRPEPYLTRAFHGASIETCLENAYAEVPVEQIDDITDMWGFTMVTGIAAIEITYTDKDWPSDPSKIVSMVS